MGNNVISLLQKLEALEFVLSVEKPSAIFLQETRLGRAGRIKTPSSLKYSWYELHRTEKAEKGVKGGGIAIGVLQALEPSWISKGDDVTEALTIEIWLDNFPVRLVCGYAPQEYDSKDRKAAFWEYLNTEIHKAAAGGAGIIIQMDGNLWAGENIIKGDLRVQNQNGKLFEQFLNIHPNISVINALPICEGKFTRITTTKSGTSKSILDFFLVCDKILPFVTKMKIDEKGETSLTKYKKGVVKADHNMLTLDIDLRFHPEKQHERLELFNLRNVNCQQKFKEYTSKSDILSKCFTTQDTLEAQFKKWQKVFNKCMHACFRKIRVTETEKKKSKLDILMQNKKNILKKKEISKEDNDKIELLDKEITLACEDKEWEKLVKVLGSLETNTGCTNNTNVWKEMAKAYPKKSKALPTGVKNVENKVITNPKEKKTVILDHFFG